jgi:hypothetical protein
MNNLIEQLCEKATIQSVSENFNGEDSLTIQTPSKEWAEKFAELIINHCIELVEPEDQEYMNSLLKFKVWCIKTDFGIK